MPPRTRALIPAVVVALALALVGCVPEPTPQAGPSGSASTSPSPSADGTPTALTFPACDELVSTETAEEFAGPGAVVDTLELEPVNMVPDYAGEFVESAVEFRSCRIAVPGHFEGTVFTVAELSGGDPARLRDLIATDPSIEATEEAGAQAFAGEQLEGYGHGYALVTLDPLWVSVFAPAPDASRELALHILASMRAANPGLPAAPDDPNATASSTPTPTPSATATPDASPKVVLPPCDDLLPLSTVHAVFGDAAEPFPPGRAVDFMPGPLAADTVRGAEQTEVCSWAIPFSDGGFGIVAAEITDAARSRLLTALRAASTYTEGTMDGSVSFSHEMEGEIGSTALVYVFVDRVWITVNGTLTVSAAQEFAGSAVDAVRAAN